MLFQYTVESVAKACAEARPADTNSAEYRAWLTTATAIADRLVEEHPKRFDYDKFLEICNN
jgi:hypothetical protein